MFSVTACGPELPLELPDDPAGRSAREIVNGKTYSGHPSVGLLTVAVGGSGARCTATLVGKRTVLTAAHCVYPGAKHSFLLDGKNYGVDAVVRHPQYTANGGTGAKNDIALFKLNADPPVTPSEVSRKAPQVGQKLTLIGYGITNTGATDSGVKRIGYNEVHQVTSTQFTFSGAGGAEANTCSGDSGGPAFATVDGKEVHLGVHSMASRPCGSTGINTRTDAYISWLEQQSGGDLYEHQPDKEPPKISITVPADGASVRRDFQVEVKATDDRNVTSVELLVDGQSAGKESGGEARFMVRDATDGKRTLRAEAVDGAGNKATAQIEVTVVPPSAYGVKCSEHLDCESTLCAAEPYLGVRFCTEACLQDSNTCPKDAACLPVAGTTMTLCGLPSGGVVDSADSSGSCAVAPLAAASDASPTTLSALLLLVAGLLVLRRRTR